MKFGKEAFVMKKLIKSLWFRLLICVVCCFFFVVVPVLIVRSTNSNGLGAGVGAITILCGLPVSSLLCGLLSAPEPKKLWMLPALPQVVYFLFLPLFTDVSLTFLLAQFSGLLFGYGAFALGIYILKKLRNRKTSAGSKSQ